MTLNEVASAIGSQVIGDGSASVTDVTHDSRQAGNGSLFVAVRGELFDAHKFILQVIGQGAVGVLSELDPTSEWRSLGESQSGKALAPAAWINVDNVRRAMALAAAEVHHHPSR